MEWNYDGVELKLEFQSVVLADAHVDHAGGLSLASVVAGHAFPFLLVLCVSDYSP